MQVISACVTNRFGLPVVAGKNNGFAAEYFATSCNLFRRPKLGMTYYVSVGPIVSSLLGIKLTKKGRRQASKSRQGNKC